MRGSTTYWKMRKKGKEEVTYEVPIQGNTESVTTSAITQVKAIETAYSILQYQ